MAVLITGGAGYIGSHAAVEFLNNDREIIILDNFYNSCPESLNRIKKITGKDFKFYECDINDREGLEKIFSENTIDSVIHFAGLKAVGESCEKPLLYYYNNISGTVALCEVMAKYGCKTIVFSSSATVYGEHNISPLNEEMQTGGTTNPYGTTKYFIERILMDLAKADSEWSVCILRYFNPLGAHESGTIGEAPNGIPNNLMPYITQVAVGKRPHLNVFGDDYDTPDGTGVRDYIHVVDLAKGHLAAMRYLENNKGVLTVNLGTGNGYTVLQVVEAYKKASGKDIPVKICPRRTGDVAANYADAKKAKELINWTAELGIDDMCRDAWNFASKNM